MEANFSTDFYFVKSILFYDTAQEINSILPFAMKYEYDIKCIAQILELKEEYISIKKFWCDTDVSTEFQIEQQEMILFIIDRINRLSIFPTISEVKKILDIEEEYLETKKFCPQERLAG